ncbi:MULTISPECIES: S8 family serine peptidase [Kitasatospora]|uniref:S8 family serine peptidase n=1 Tax=Kitasatospora cathayae TaxID=3004092 RepID=A0ABY7Q2E4_9ACTN|nr:S8 family serine peptidase [Kitasatospora sp. HUAS 3-15]WBP86868.1 S8 family serine peptidase [Kitasatospora sp. HUAS 3-15]
MRLPPVRRKLARIGLTLTLLAGGAALAATPAAGGPAGAGPPTVTPSGQGRTASVLLELSTEAAGPAWRHAADTARRAQRSPDDVRLDAARAGAAQRARAGDALHRLAQAVHRSAPAARELYRTHTLLTGLAVSAPAERLSALRALPGVRAVHPIVNKQRDNAYSVPLTGAPQVWSGDAAVAGNTGRGTRIGIIDSGIDYTHADFGGPGTEEAFRSVERGKPAPPALFPNAKVIGGKDLVGDDYDPDPTAPNHQPVPHPSDNPLDCVRNGHGTHVAGTAAGYGVTADGHPYAGPYRPGLDPASFRIGPGAAPGAQLYAIRVFGCDGSTDRLAQALDLAADPNGDGDLGDRLDVVNLSLGSRFGSPDDADALAVDRLAELGTVVVAAVGNEGDVYGIGGSPGTAVRAITVAASVHGHADVDGITVLAPAALAGVVPGHWSERYRGWSSTEVSGALAAPVDQADGCTDFSEADKQRLKGRIAVLTWRTRDADRACNSAPRADHAADAGAIGALYAADTDHLAEISGNDRIPAVLLGRADGERLLKAAAEGDAQVRLAAPGNPLHGSVAQNQPARADTLTDFTSRGIGLPGVLKPDLAAPGETIWSALVGSGSGGQRENGTSMAAPHVAGLAALVRAAHPDWPVEQVKAALMNTSTDTYLGDDHGGPVYGPERTGAGRVQADRAVRTPVVAYAAGEGARPGNVGVSYGPVEISGPTALDREIELRNSSSAPLSYRTGYAASTQLPGAAFQVAPAQVDVPAGGTARVRVTLSVPGELGRTPDPTIDTLQGGRARSYRGELSGRVLFSPVGDRTLPQLRVPVFAAPRPTGDLGATAAARTARDGTLVILGGSAAPGEAPGLVSALALGGEGARWPDCPPGSGKAVGPGAGIRPEDAPEPADQSQDLCVERPGDRAADLRAAGAAVDSDLLYVGARLWAPAATPVGLYGVRVSLDTDGDGVTDVILKADRLRGSDVLVSRALDARTGDELDVQPLNAHWGDTDTELLDSDVVVLPVRLSALPGVGPGHSTVRYGVWAGTAAPGKPDPAEAYSAIGLRGTRPTIPLDLLHPALTVRTGPTGPTTMVTPAGPGTVLDVHRTPGDTSRLLLLHHLNPADRRAQVLDLP